ARCLLSEHLFGHAAEAPALYRAGLLRHGGYRGSIWAALVRELHEGESDPAPLPAPWAIHEDYPDRDSYVDDEEWYDVFHQMSEEEAAELLFGDRLQDLEPPF
ncbi:MAG: hypothetical protein WB974_15070, partial [Acidobacteriaceae bacterium]